MSQVRETVLSSLSAVGATQEAKFYAEMFASQDAERFALLIVDERCIKNPLLESLVSTLRILSNLQLTPVLLVGAMDGDRTSVKFQAQRLAKEMEQSNIRVAKLNTASYGLIDEVRKKCHAKRTPVLEMTDRRGPMNLQRIARELRPNKVLFLQPSGGLSHEGRRRANLTIAQLPEMMESQTLSVGQARVLSKIKELEDGTDQRRAYIIASPLNLLSELFTTKGSGTFIRRGADIKTGTDLSKFDVKKLRTSIESAFDRKLSTEALKRAISIGYIESDYRGGALFRKLDGLSYLSKFWVTKEAQGEGIARDIWNIASESEGAFFWRSRLSNPFNEWYMKSCDGMQREGEWRVFWRGLATKHVARAIKAAVNAPIDFID